MTLFGLFWAAHLPSTQAINFSPVPIALLGDVAGWVVPSHPAPHLATDPMALDPLGPGEAVEPASTTPLHSLESRPLKNLGGAVDWQRWKNTAAVTVVDISATEDLATAHLEPNDLASISCPAAHPKHAGDQHLAPTAAATTSEATTSEATVSDSTAPKGGIAEDSSFVIQVKGVAIGQLASVEVAEQVAADLRQAMPILAQQPQDLAPTMEGNRGMGELQDHTIFSLSPAALGEEESVALTTVQWVNNLRIALGAAPLNPGQVQRVAYGLDHTSTQLQGTASWYGPYFHGRQTATGEIFDQNALTAAHKTLPFDTYLEVRNLLNGKTVVVRINDRGPYVGERSLDLSYAAARCLGSVQVGVIPYEATILTPGDPQTWEEAALPL